jgi:hypothetical protein
MIAGSAFYCHGSQIFERPEHSDETRPFAIVHPSRHGAEQLAGLLAGILTEISRQLSGLPPQEIESEIVGFAAEQREL